MTSPKRRLCRSHEFIAAPLYTAWPGRRACCEPRPQPPRGREGLKWLGAFALQARPRPELSTRANVECRDTTPICSGLRLRQRSGNSSYHDIVRQILRPSTPSDRRAPRLPHGAQPHLRAFVPEFLSGSELIFPGSVSGRHCSAGDDDRHDARERHSNFNRHRLSRVAGRTTPRADSLCLERAGP
jgi:hypothetical protein